MNWDISRLERYTSRNRRGHFEVRETLPVTAIRDDGSWWIVDVRTIR